MDDRESAHNKPEINGFEFQEKLGESLMSTVWKAEQISLRRPTVIKILSENLSSNFDDIKQFMFEARVAANLKHPNIVQIYDFGQSSNRYYFVMEYISGYTVGDWLRRKGKLDEENCLLIVHSVSTALDYAWQQSQIIHCDIKPDNIMVDGDGTIKLMDMGLSKAVSLKEKSHNNPDDEVLVVGTPNYMSPEQATGDAKLDFHTDIYALGASLYHLLTGHLPFGDSPPDKAMERQCTDFLPDPRELNSAISVGMVCLIEKMMAKDPEARHNSWTEVVEDICLVENNAMPAGKMPDPGISTVTTNVLDKARAQLDMESQIRHAEREETRREAMPEAKPEETKPEEDSEHRDCPFCAERIKKNAIVCRFCGKDLKNADPKEPKPLKVARKSPADRKPEKQGSEVIVKPPDPEPKEEEPPKKTRKRKKRKIGFWANIRMLVSVFLIAFFAYYIYMKTQRDVDVLDPVRNRIREKVEQGTPGLAKAFDELMKKFGGGGDREPAVNHEPLADDDFIYDESEPIPEEQDSEPVPEEQEVVDTPPPEPVDITETDQYQKILAKCEELRPDVGSNVQIKLNSQDEEIVGEITEINETCVVLKVPKGTISCPFELMDEKSREQFFPSERARNVYSRLKEQGKI